jgi:hypothetical protein
MELRARTRISLRRVALAAAFGALLAPVTGANAAEAAKKPKTPVVTAVAPMQAEVGDELTIRGRHFRVGRNKNTVVFKRDGARAIFVRAHIGTTKLLKVKVPDSLDEFLTSVNGAKTATRFRLRVLSERFGKGFTGNGRSPMIAPDTPPVPPVPPQTTAEGDCDNDGAVNSKDADDDNDGASDATEAEYGLDKCKADTDGDGLEDRWEIDCDRDTVLNHQDTDDDNDLLDDVTEAAAMTDPCAVDTDKDGIEDGYEYKSARDLNDSEHQHPDTFMPYPGKRPYPNPLDGSDAGIDHDGDSLTLTEEFQLWKHSYATAGTATRTLSPLSYSAGEQYSVHTRDAGSNRVPALSAFGYERQQNFLDWAASTGHLVVRYAPAGTWWHDLANTRLVDIRDADLSGSCAPAPCTPAAPSAAEVAYFDDGDGWLTDAERDEDADGLSNYTETHGPLLNVGWWTGRFGGETPYPVVYAGTSAWDADSDGDGVRDGADDQDNDDMPNILEADRVMSQGPVDADVDPLTPAIYLEDYVAPTGDAMGWVVDSRRILDEANLALRRGDMPRAWVSPFNPCLPNPWSRTCNRHPAFGGGHAPFNEAEFGKYFFIRN